MKLLWHEKAWEEYTYWISNDKKTVKRINLLLTDITRNSGVGLGKPEKLRGNLCGWSSRRIDSEHRLVYKEQGENIVILSCKGHYDS